MAISIADINQSIASINSQLPKGITPLTAIPVDVNGNPTSASPTSTTPTAPATTSIGSPVTAPTTTPNSSPTLPAQTAPTALTSFFGSAASQVQSAQAQADQQLAQRTAANQAQLDAANKQQSDLSVLQQNGFDAEAGALQTATSEKQQALALEQSQYETNYNLNQGFLSQMQDLVTAGNNQIEQMKGMPLAANSTIGNARVQQSVSDLAAQVGSMQTLMSAASGQMAAAKTQLDTTVSTVSSIYSDQVNYYTALQSFYSNQEKSNDSKIATLTADQKTYLDQQLTEAQSNLAQVQKNAQSLADAMTNPDTALAYNQAGVTVNDTPEQINQKLATYAYSKELSTQSQNMADKGYQAVIPGQKVPANAVDTLTVTDSKGIPCPRSSNSRN